LFIGSDMVDIWRLSLDVFVVFFNVKMSNIICIFIFLLWKLIDFALLRATAPHKKTEPMSLTLGDNLLKV